MHGRLARLSRRYSFQISRKTFSSGTRNGLARQPIDDKEPEHAEIGRDWTKHYRIGSKFNAISCVSLARGPRGLAAPPAAQRERDGDTAQVHVI